MKIAVVLFNLGGPDGQAAVRPFLFNLFNDPAIIRLPQPFRWMVAQLISRRREKTAQAIYAHMGGGSPILPETQAQARALEAALNGAESPGEDGHAYRVHIAMRYWHPRGAATMEAVKAQSPDRILLLPLYPQFSTTTSASSFQEIAPLLDAYRADRVVAANLDQKADPGSDFLCCYPTEPGFIAAQAALLEEMFATLDPAIPMRVLFSAHGLPQKIVDDGDPYQWQVERSVEAVLEALAARGIRPESRICYQSRVGPMQWLKPATDAEIVQAGKDGMGIVLVPIAFVSEHSETLVELDIEYRHLAEAHGVPAYHRVRTVGTHPAFIEGLARMVQARVAQGGDTHRTAPGDGSLARLCPPEFTGCACRMPG